MNKTKQDIKTSNQGFTLLEMMIAIAIFGFFLLIAAQFTRTQIHLFDTASKQNDAEQKARVAMMQLMDEIRLNLVFYESTTEEQSIKKYATPDAAASQDTTGSSYLIYVSLQDSPVTPPSTDFFFDKHTGKLWYFHNPDYTDKYLIADHIAKLSITGDSSQVKIDIITDGNNGSQPYELITWMRLH